MIVRSTDAELFLITQPDHAALARRVMDCWAPLRNAARRESILHAIEHHDNGWQEPDDEPSADPATGRVFDFITVPPAVRQGVWPRAVSRLAHDPWAAALVAQHAVTVYDRYRADPEWAAFFSRMTSMRDAQMCAAGRSSTELASDYVYVRLGDLISLVFCNQWTDAQTFEGWTVQLHGDDVHVTPDGFEGRDVAMAVLAREIPNVPYTSDAALRTALRASVPRSLHGIVTGAL